MLEQRLASGTVDLVSQNPGPMDQLVRSGKIVGNSVTPFQLAELGVAALSFKPNRLPKGLCLGCQFITLASSIWTSASCAVATVLRAFSSVMPGAVSAATRTVPSPPG